MEALKGLLNKAKEQLKKGIKNFANKILKALLTNPWFWLVCAVFFILIIVVGTFIDIDGGDVEDVTAGMYSSSDDQWEQLIRYIGYMEGGRTTYKNSRGEDCYKVIFDAAAGNPGIVGLDFVAGGYGSYFSSLGYDISVGSLIPVDVVNQKKAESIKQNYYNTIKSYCSSAGYNLTQYQLFALTSRAFNHGSYGAFYNVYTSESFKDAYKNYWKQSRDDKFKKTKEPDLNHKLYSRAMNGATRSNGVYYSGLERRRESEFRLFQCGWYYWDGLMDEQFIEESSYYGGGSGGDILATAERMHKYMEDHNYSYNGTYASTFEGSKKYRACVCASLVSWVLIDCGYINKCYHDCGNLDDLLAANSNFQRIDKVKKVSQLKPGDILIYLDHWAGGFGRVHTEIYAGNNTIYNAGSTDALRRKNPYYKNMQAELDSRPNTRVYRLKQSSKNNKSGSSSANISSGGYDSIYTSSITGKKFKEFKQNSPSYRYPSIPSNCSWSSECGTVSTLIVGSGYNNKLTLQDAANRLHATGGSTNIIGYTAYFTGKSVEAESTPISVSSMTKHLKKGDVAVIHNPGYSGNGHYLALLDISKDGKEVYISNPDVYGGKTGGYNGATKQGWNSISKVCSALNETVDWVKK